MNIPDKIKKLVEEDIKQLPPHLQSWVNEHLISPREIKLAIDSGGNEYSEYWLVTDNIGKSDSSYRVVYDESQNEFGLECTLQNGLNWLMGIYGTFSESIKNM